MGPSDGRATSEFNQARAEAAVKELLLSIGEDPDRDGLRELSQKTLLGFGNLLKMFSRQLLILAMKS